MIESDPLIKPFPHSSKYTGLIATKLIFIVKMGILRYTSTLQSQFYCSRDQLLLSFSHDSLISITRSYTKGYRTLAFIQLEGFITNDIINELYKQVERCECMEINFFEHQKTIANNLRSYMRLKGYSKLSLSKLTEIPRSDIDNLLNDDNANIIIYNNQISQILKTFNLPRIYFLTTVLDTESTLDPSLNEDQRSPRIKELFDGLENVLEIFSMYKK
jgi:hypothetical protein